MKYLLLAALCFAGCSSSVSRPGPQGPAGPTGPQGIAGATGAEGVKGATGATGVAGAQGVNGPEGPIGPQGPTGTNGTTGPSGATGVQGIAGTAGATGATGPTGAAVNYALFYALMPTDNSAAVAVGASVQFPQDGPSSGTLARATLSSFLLPAIGTYEIAWQVSVSEPGQLVLSLNGVAQPYTAVGRGSGTTQIVGDTLLTTRAINSTLTLQNPAGNSGALMLTPMAGGSSAVSATLLIKQLD